MSQPPYGPPRHGEGWADGQPLAKPPLHRRPWFAVGVVLLAIGGVGSAVSGGRDEASTASPPTTASQEPTAPSTTQAPPAEVDFPMPDFVGMDLQSAQNLVQDHGVYVSRSHDLLGSRNQVVDSNWIVCDQNIPPGQQVTGNTEGVIDFGVVKREESCP